MRELDRAWPPDCLTDLLCSTSLKVVRVATVCLGHTGAMPHCRFLAPLLRHIDDDIAQAAEDGLWSIWMRAGSLRGTRELADALRCIEADDFGSAVYLLSALAVREPGFAEVHHQRGIALCLLERLDEAEEAYRQAVQLNAYHFSAVAGLGHVRAEHGDVEGTLYYYRQALRINPRLSGLPEAVAEIEALMLRGRAAL